MADRYALISDGIVRNVCLWDGNVATWRPEPEFQAIACPDEVAIGWTWDGNAWGDPVPVPGPVPDSVSDRQLFQALATLNLITQAEALDAVKTGTLPALMQDAVDALPEDMKFAVSMQLCGATTFERNHPTTAQLGGAFGWSEQQIDDLWRLAGTL